jgi:hypothetical protein
VDAALPTSQKEKIAGLVPFYFVDFKLERMFYFNLEIPGINKSNKVFLISHCDRISIR